MGGLQVELLRSPHCDPQHGEVLAAAAGDMLTALVQGPQSAGPNMVAWVPLAEGRP